MSGYVHMDGDGVTTGPAVGPFLSETQTRDAVNAVTASLAAEKKIRQDVSISTVVLPLNSPVSGAGAEAVTPYVALTTMQTERPGLSDPTISASWSFLGLPALVAYPVVAETLLRLQDDVVRLASERVEFEGRERLARLRAACHCGGDVEWNEGIPHRVTDTDPHCPLHGDDAEDAEDGDERL